MDIGTEANWNDMRFLLALAREGSALKAARMLGVSHQTVSRRLGELEKSLGTRLVDRSGSNWQLSTVGQGIARQADEMEAAMRAAAQRARTGHKGLAGRVRITSASAGFEWFVLPEIRALSMEYPGIEFDFIADNAPLDMGSGLFDIAVRFSGSPAGNLVGRNAGPVEFGLFGAPEDMAALDEAVEKGTRITLPFIALLTRHLRSQDWLPENIDPASPVSNVSGLSTLISAVKNGLGAGFLPVAVGRELEGLMECKSLKRRYPFDVWVLTSEDSRPSERVRLVAKRLHKAIAGKLSRAD